MPTPDPTRACPALAILNNTMGRDPRTGQQLWPEHRPHGAGAHCGHCGATPPKGKP